MNTHPSRLMWLAAFGLLAVVIIFMSAYSVRETDQVIVTRYGNPVRVVNEYKPKQSFGNSGAGLHFRIPFYEQLQVVDKRIQRVEMDTQEVLSTDQLRLQVDAYARFRIVDPLRMYRTIRTEEQLTNQLKSILGSRLRNELGKRNFATLLSPERGEVMENIQGTLETEAAKYGAQVIDVRIKRADLPAGSPLQSAYDRMRSARTQEAVSIRAEGNKEAQIIRAEANADAARIYADAYGKDPEFYDFYRAMQSYRTTFTANPDKASNMVLSPDSEYLRKFNGGGK